jgi:hypothetical protein
MLEEFFDVYPYKTPKSIFIIISVLDRGRYDVLYVDTTSHETHALTLASKDTIKRFLEAKPLLAGRIVIAVLVSRDGLRIEKYFEKEAPYLDEIMEFIDGV